MSDDDIHPPRPIGDRVEINITGYLVPYLDDARPAVIKIIGSDKFYLPVFENIEKFEIGMVRIPYKKIKQIDSGIGFLDATPEGLTVIANIRLENGKARFTQIFEGKSDE